MNSSQKYLVGVDIGGTKIEAALVHPLTAEVLKRKRIPTEREKGINHIIQILTELIKEIIHPHSLDQITGLGIGVPGIVHPRTQIMQNGNTQALIGVDLRKLLKESLSFKGEIVINNDANCFTYAEAIKGVGLTHAQNFGLKIEDQIAIGLTLGTGTGGGIVLGKKIFTGAHGSASEFGHMALIHDGPLCHCQKPGHSEVYLSGTGIEREYTARTQTHLSSKEIFASKSPEAQEVISNFQKLLARFISDLCSSFDPDYFVIGGGVGLQEAVHHNLEENVWAQNFNPSAKPKIYKHTLGDSAGVIGAALLAATAEF